MIEIALGLAFVFLVLVFFYKQTSEEFHILQIESEKLETLPELLSEKDPIVVRGLGQPKLLTPETLRGSRFQTFPVSRGFTLGEYLAEPEGKVLEPLPEEVRKRFANEVGLQVWAEHMWFPKITEDLPYSFIMSLESEVYMTGMGMRKTAAATTLLYPTSGTFTCSIAMASATKYLPAKWQDRFIADLKADDSPLLHEVQYLDIILRPGHILMVPPHWIVSMRATKGEIPIFGWIEIHHPISKLEKLLS